MMERSSFCSELAELPALRARFNQAPKKKRPDFELEAADAVAQAPAVVASQFINDLRS
jgi:hypothetical protein